MLRRRAPFRRQLLQRLGHSCFLSKQLRLPRRIELDLRRIKRHHIQRYSRSKQRLRSRNIVHDVPLRIGLLLVAIPMRNRSAHKDDPLQLAKSLWIFRDQSSHVRQRRHRYQRDLPRISANRIQHELNRIRVGPIGRAFRPLALGKMRLSRSLRPFVHWNILTPRRI